MNQATQAHNSAAPEASQPCGPDGNDEDKTVTIPDEPEIIGIPDDPELERAPVNIEDPADIAPERRKS